MPIKLPEIEANLAQSIFDVLRRGEYPDELVNGKFNVDTSYRIQSGIIEAQLSAGRELGGWKTSFIPESMAAIYGGVSFLAGPLYADGLRDSGCELSKDIPGLLLEVEVGLLLGDSLQGPDVTSEQARAAVAGIMPCFEIVGGKLPRMSAETSPGFIACGLGNWGVVRGSGLHEIPASFDSAKLRAELWINDERLPDNPMLGNPACPFDVLAALANHLATVNRTLHAGECVITGARALKAKCSKGRYEARIEQLGSVGLTLD